MPVGRELAGERSAARAGADDDHVVMIPSCMWSSFHSLAVAAAEDAALVVLVVELGAEHATGAANRRKNCAASEHSDRWRDEVDPQGRVIRSRERADPNVRAGFMLMPDTGDSNADVERDQGSGKYGVKRASGL